MTDDELRYKALKHTLVATPLIILIGVAMALSNIIAVIVLGLAALGIIIGIVYLAIYDILQKQNEER